MTAMMRWMARAALACYPFPRGQGRIIDKTFLARMKFRERTMRVRTTDGFAIKVFPNDHIGRHICLSGEFDRTIPEVLIHLSRPGDRILDVGANVGYVSCVLLSKIADSRVVSVEPQPDVYAVLADNVRSVGNERARPIHCAISNRRGAGKLALTAGNSGAGRLVASDAPGVTRKAPADIARELPADLAREMPHVEVDLVTGAELFLESGLDRLDLVKVDVEGHEFEVLSSMAGVIEKERPRAIVFEHWTPLTDGNAPVRPLLEGLGYEIHALHKSLLRWKLVPLADATRDGISAHDYVALPRTAA